MLCLIGKIVSWLPWSRMGNCQNTVVLRESRIPELRARERDDIPRRIREEVWKQWCEGSSEGNCFCCDIQLNADSWHCGHILPRARGGSPHLHNLRPLCANCNLSMGNRHMFEYIILQRLPGRRHIRESPLYVYFKQKRKILQDIDRQIIQLSENKKITKTLMKKLHNLAHGKGERWLEITQLLQSYI